MKINIEIDLSIEEIKFLRNFPDGKLPNTIVWKLNNRKVDYFDELYTKGIIMIDSMSNANLTKIGQEIIKKISRENIIDKLID